MGKTIKCDLSTKSIQNAINKLKVYQNELQRKNEIFVKRLAEIGLEVIQTTMESLPDEEKVLTIQKSSTIKTEISSGLLLDYLVKKCCSLNFQQE